MKPAFLIILTGWLAMAASASAANDLKIGYVDTARVLKEAPQSETARKKLKDEFNPRDEKIVDMQNRLKAMTEQQERDDKVMSNTARRKLERDILTLKRDIKRAKEEFTEDFNLRRNEELAKLQRIIQKTTVDLAKDRGFDVVLSESVLYSSKRVDITDLVLERLRKASQQNDRTNNKK